MCRKFFCKTLAISKKTVQYVLRNRNALGHFESPNVEGSRKAVNKTSNERESLVREHVESFPRMESHYCRANTAATYLSPELNISEMYRLYVHDFCVRRNITDPVTKGVYRRIFVSDFNIRFFVPKKDQCSLCNGYYEAIGDDKELLKTEWEEHKKGKESRWR